MSEITKEQKITALKESIAKYISYLQEDPRRINPTARDCACCQLVKRSERMVILCHTGCPIYDYDPIHEACENTPYYKMKKYIYLGDAGNITRQIKEEISFLTKVLDNLEMERS